MDLSAEAIIALIALFVACIPGIRFILKHRNKLRRWWGQTQHTELPQSGKTDLTLILMVQVPFLYLSL
jgi:hypothetical protein